MNITTLTGRLRPTGVSLPSLPLALTRVHENLTVTATQTVAWYRVTPVSWSWRGDTTREQIIQDIALTALGLGELEIHLRSTPRPYPVAAWAAAYDANSRPPHTHTPPNPRAFRRHLLDTQRYLRDANLDDQEVFLGVTIAGRSDGDHLSAAFNRAIRGRREQQQTEQRARELTEVLGSSASLHAVPCTQGEVERLVQRSVGLGLPEPVNVDQDTFTDPVDVDPCIGHRYVKVTGHAGHYGQTVDRYVAVLSLGRAPDHLDIPQRHDPWMAAAHRLDFPVEWSARFRVVPGDKAAKKVDSMLKRVREDRRGYAAAGVEEPPATERSLRRGRDMQDEMTTGNPVHATRVYGWWRLAVSGRTPDEVQTRARAVVRHYRERQQWTVRHDLPGQHALYREFIPGERVGTVNHEQHMPLATWAAAVPHVAASVGDTDDRRGHYLGQTTGAAKRAVTWDPHAAMERHDRSGLTAVLGGLGSGKSGLVGFLAFESALRGIPTTVFDPSGPLGRLAHHPDLGGRGEVVNLLDSRPGLLSPFTVVSEPRRERFYDDPDVTGLMGEARETTVDALHAEAVLAARKMREQLANDILRSLLPYETRTNTDASDVLQAIRAAVRDVGGDRHRSLNDVVAKLKASDVKAVRAAAADLEDVASWPQARLFFGSGYLAEYAEDREHNLLAPVLTVITMPGLVLPQSPDESRWTEQERLALPLLASAAHYASRRCYDKPMRARAVFGFDEAHVLRNVPAGAALIDRLARDSRKWNLRVLIASQKPGDFRALDVDGLLSETFIGRVSGDDDTDHAIARDALALAGIPRDHGYESLLAGLSRDGRGEKVREFVFTDVHGNHERVRIDLRHMPHLRELIETTPGVRTTVVPPAGFTEDQEYDPELVSA